MGLPCSAIISRACAKTRQRSRSQVAKAEPVKPEPLRWYEGGTLHDSPASQWLTASYRDKIATSADWVVTMRGQDQYDGSIANAIPDAKAMVTCLNEALAGPVIPKDSLGYLAAVCVRLMGSKICRSEKTSLYPLFSGRSEI